MKLLSSTFMGRLVLNRAGLSLQPMLFALSLILTPFAIKAQSFSPAPHSHEKVSVARAAVTDTITYTGLVSSTTVNTQYVSHGALFMGYDGSGDPSTYDYGDQSWGSVMISDNWYNPIRMNFVDTLDSSIPAFAKKIEFDNPIDGEVDYIKFKVYDENDNLIHSYVSTSPEHVVVEFDNYIASYVVFDDSLETAYVVDNILLDIANGPVAIEEAELLSLDIFPNPSNGEFTIHSGQYIKEIRVMDAAGKQLEVINPYAKNYKLEIHQPGVHYLVIHTATDSHTRKVVVKQ